MSSPLRARNVEREYKGNRPRDAAIRQAANDNPSYTPANDNRPRDFSRPTVDEEFDATYAQSGMQPTVGYRPLIRNVQVDQQRRGQSGSRAVGTSMRATGAGMRASGAVLQGTGKVMRRGGTAAVRTGVAMSSTGVGAIVGVPLAVVGAGTAAVGAGVETTGRVTRQIGRRVSRVTRGKSERLFAVKNLPKEIKKEVKGLGVLIRNASIGFWIWFFLQLPLAILSLLFFGLAYLVHDFTPAIIKTAVEWIGNAFKTLTGFDLAALDPSAFFIMSHTLVFFVGLSTLIILSVMYQLSMTNCLFGKQGSGIKVGMFLLAICGYTFPFLNLFPWFIFWIIVVWRYPK